MNNVTNILSRWYYTFFVLVVIAAGSMWYVFSYAQLLQLIDPQSSLGLFIQYLVIFYVIASVPGALYGFKRLMDKRVKKIEDEELRFAAYKKYATLRIAIIGLGAVLGVVALYAMKHQPMLWCAGISLIAMFFCKPNDRKMELELLNEELPQ